MQRRQLLKLLPISLLATGAVAGVSIFRKAACNALDASQLLMRLAAFSDASLGKNIKRQINANDMKRFDLLCAETFDDGYRQLLAKDFVEGKTKMVDSWILSETEELTHRAVYVANHKNQD